MKKTATNHGKKAQEFTPKPTEKALKMTAMTSDTDINGSYTGTPENKWEKPVQDADDL